MKVSPQATEGHLVAGAALVGLALGAAIAALLLRRPAFAALVFFFGVWGGVELGRSLERSLSTQQE